MRSKTMQTFVVKSYLVLLFIINGSKWVVATESACGNINELKQLMIQKLEEVEKTCDMQYKELEQEFDSQISRRSFAGGIAFSAQLSVQQTHIPTGTTIKFDKVLVNDGSGYDKQTGVFIAPEEGVYMLTYFIGNGNNVGQSWVGLMHNGQRINSAVTDPFHQYQDVQGANMAVVRMAAGDRVWIESFHQGNAYLDGPNGFTSFSGMYLNS